MIPMIVKALGTILNNLEKRARELEIRGRIKILQIIAQLRSVECLEGFWRAEETCCHSQ